MVRIYNSGSKYSMNGSGMDWGCWFRLLMCYCCVLFSRFFRSKLRSNMI